MVPSNLNSVLGLIGAVNSSKSSENPLSGSQGQENSAFSAAFSDAQNAAASKASSPAPERANPPSGYVSKSPGSEKATPVNSTDVPEEDSRAEKRGLSEAQLAALGGNGLPFDGQDSPALDQAVWPSIETEGAGEGAGSDPRNFPQQTQIAAAVSNASQFGNPSTVDFATRPLGAALGNERSDLGALNGVGSNGVSPAQGVRPEAVSTLVAGQRAMAQGQAQNLTSTGDLPAAEGVKADALGGETMARARGGEGAAGINLSGVDGSSEGEVEPDQFAKVMRNTAETAGSKAQSPNLSASAGAGIETEAAIPAGQTRGAEFAARTGQTPLTGQGTTGAANPPTQVSEDDANLGARSAFSDPVASAKTEQKPVAGSGESPLTADQKRFFDSQVSAGNKPAQDSIVSDGERAANFNPKRAAEAMLAGEQSRPSVQSKPDEVTPDTKATLSTQSGFGKSVAAEAKQLGTQALDASSVSEGESDTAVAASREKGQQALPEAINSQGRGAENRADAAKVALEGAAAKFRSASNVTANGADGEFELSASLDAQLEEPGLDTKGFRIPGAPTLGQEQAPQARPVDSSGLQNLNVQPVVQQRAPETSLTQMQTLPGMQATPEMPEFPQELLQKVRFANSNGFHEAKLNLHPAELGRMSISITTDGDTAKVAFTVENQAARDAIEQQMPRLREMFSQAGMQLADTSVGQGGQHSQERFEAGSGRSNAYAGTSSGESDDGSANKDGRKGSDPNSLLDAYA